MRMYLCIRWEKIETANGIFNVSVWKFIYFQQFLLISSLLLPSKMPLSFWNITSVETTGNTTKICGVSRNPYDVWILETYITKTTLDELTENDYPFKSEWSSYAPDSAVCIVNKEACYKIHVVKSYKDYAKHEYEICVKNNTFKAEYIAELKERHEEINRNCETWPTLPSVKAEDHATEKNHVCSTYYFGLPQLVYCQWFGMISCI